MTVVLGGYNGLGDLGNYSYRYIFEVTNDQYIEGLYDIIARAFHRANISFEAFHLIITFISILFFAITILKISQEPALTISLLFGFSTLEYALQIKGMIAAALITVSLYFYYKTLYLKQYTLKNVAVYIALILLSAGFHFISFFFLSFLFIGKNIDMNINKRVLILLIIISGVLPYLLDYLSKYISALNFYIGQYRRPQVFIGLSLWQLAGFFITKSISKAIKRKSDFNLFVLQGSILMFLVIPFYSLTSVVNRVIRIWSIFTYIHCSELNSKIILKLIMITYSITTFIFFYVIIPKFGNNTYSVLTDVLDNNIFW